MEYREFRAAAQESEGKLYGVAAPFNSETVIGDLKRGGWREKIAPGAFKKTIGESDTVLLCDHDMSKPLARVSAKTLTLRETDAGVEFEGEPAPTTYAQDLMVNIRAGNKGGMSIGFTPVKDDWYDDEGKPSNRHLGTQRVIREVKLPEISCVTNPAYKDTTLMARDELLAEREARADDNQADNEYDALAEQMRAADINTAGRKALAAKGHALPDGSYPIPDKSHLHAAAVLAASGHGDVKAAKALIRRRAKELGVDVKTLPGFGGDDDRSAERDDPDGKEYEAIDEALRQIKAGDTKGAEKTLAANQAARNEQEPDTSTPGDAETVIALARLAQERARSLGIEA